MLPKVIYTSSVAACLVTNLRLVYRVQITRKIKLQLLHYLFVVYLTTLSGARKYMTVFLSPSRQIPAMVP
jgi:hypothetical protein